MNAVAAMVRALTSALAHLARKATIAWQRRAARSHPSPFAGGEQARRHADGRKQFWAELHAGERLAQQRSRPN